jgi:hypothetical protein
LTLSGWVAAGDIEAGDKVYLYSGEGREVKEVRFEYLDTPIKVYNFEVEDWHTYFVSEQDVFVHNSCKGKGNSRTSSKYEDITSKRSRYTNKSTDVTKVEFEKNLLENGWTKSISKDGKTIILEKDGAKYVLRDFSKSTGGPTADFYKAGSKSFYIKIRLGGN